MGTSSFAISLRGPSRLTSAVGTICHWSALLDPRSRKRQSIVLLAKETDAIPSSDEHVPPLQVWAKTSVQSGVGVEPLDPCCSCAHTSHEVVLPPLWHVKVALPGREFRFGDFTLPKPHFYRIRFSFSAGRRAFILFVLNVMPKKVMQLVGPSTFLVLMVHPARCKHALLWGDFLGIGTTVEVPSVRN